MGGLEKIWDKVVRGEKMSILLELLYLLVFPGFLFLITYALFVEYVDRKLYARFQNRVGPPIYQPLADIIKLLSKEDIVSKMSDSKMVSAIPLFAFASVITAFLYIPIWFNQSIFSFQGDLIVVLYLLSIPTLALFLAGWHSSNPFSQVGAMRAITQLFAYEVPFFLVLLGTAIIADSWSIIDIVNFQSHNFWLILMMPLGFIVAIIALQGKLERIPFDIPDAETEIVGGMLVEYVGKRLALFRLAIDIEMVVGAALISALFLGGFDAFISVAGLSPLAQFGIGFAAFLVKTLFIVFLLASIRALFARLRIDQMVTFCFKWLAPLSIIQLLLITGIKYMGWF